MPGGPRFLDEHDDTPAPRPGAPIPGPAQPGAPLDAAPLPRGPVLLEAGPDAAGRLDVGWMPEVVAPPRPRVGAGFWAAARLCTLVASWLALSVASFVLTLSRQSGPLGALAAAAIGGSVAMVAYAVLLEVRAYRSLGTVERLRVVWLAADTTLGVARAEAGAWLSQLGTGIPDRAAVERLLEGATTVAEVRGILRSQVADRLREAAGSMGRRVAVEGATLAAVCPHPAWDGLIAGGRGLLVIRHVAALYGLRPGLAVTLALLRRVAWTAAGTAGLSLVSQGLADHALASMPVLKHVAGALPGTGAVAVRLYRLAGVTAKTCSPVP